MSSELVQAVAAAFAADGVLARHEPGFIPRLAQDQMAERIAQAARVASVVIADSAATRIVMGDLNAPGEVEVIRELRVAGLRDPGGGPTNPSIAPRQRLDYVLVPDTATVVEQHEPDGGEDWWAISDHLPVLVAFRQQ